MFAARLFFPFNPSAIHFYSVFSHNSQSAYRRIDPFPPPPPPPPSPPSPSLYLLLPLLTPASCHSPHSLALS
ncbi:hypothetical protein BO99DRAFT_252819 [Aspergillus violaceofuscus CBS 115571]|uniref:Uncharacterized protein n=1 Tax=Aspergillus violaceofuscus (strain CBS 115571) TaxID=1450538 RepID=A0A2V5I6Y4_ASPV1|nr:hypothetical protein BO99DRAFT_252819 [Aspergillus violaceofuscus CBS 115571]